MKKNYVLSLMALLGMMVSGYGQIATIDFETNLAGYSHTPSQLPSADPGDQYFHRAIPSDASIYEGSVGPYTNVTGSWMFVGSNPNTINGGSPGILTLDPINVSGYSNLELSIDFGAVPNDWDAADELSVEYRYDNTGAWSTLFSFSSPVINDPLELSGNATGGINTANGTVLTYALQTITSDNFAGSGTNLNIRIVCNSDANYEAFGLDNIVLNGTASCTPPANPIGTISGTTPACNSTTLTYTGATIPGTVDYWQTTATGTSTTNNATGTFNATSSGTYYVRTFLTATSCWSTGAASYAVVINTAPTISTQPADAARVIPNTATFSVTGTSTPAPTYQWQVSTNGGTTWINITGATTASYTTGATTAGMNGNQYRCVLTNTCGSAISSPATLTLTNSSPNNAQNLSGCFEDTSVILAWNNPATPPTGGYVIFAIAGTTDPTVPPNDAGTYTANSNFSAAPFETPASLGKVVYKGNGTTATVTSLTEDTTYSFRIFAYNGETLTGWSNGTSGGSNLENIAQGDVRNLVATPLTNQVNLNWNNPLPTSCFDQLIIVANEGPVTFTPSGTYPNTDVDYTTPNSIVFSTTGTVSVNSVNGLTNGTNYCFKVFIRRGTNWSEGVEVCTVPSLTYCASSGNGTDGYLTLIRNVEFNTIDNPSPNIDNAYSDFTSVSTDVTLGNTYNLNVRVNTDTGNGAFTTTTRAWIDWNNDGTFDANEQYELGNAFNVSDGSTDASPLAIEVPTNAAIAATRMRVSTRFTTTPSTACLNNFDGEVEDYTINVVQPVNAEINIKGNNITIPNGFNAPYGLNNTLFGAQNVGSTSAAKSYFIENIGATTLNLTGAPRVQIIGANAGDFNVVLQPSATVNSASNSEFTIEFSPTADGTRTATVSISNSDSDENPYLFDIEGTAVCSTALTSTMWPLEGPENTEVTFTSANDLTGATATINGLPMAIVSSSSTELVVSVPTGASSGNISVLFSSGCSSTNAFTIIDNVIGGCETAVASTIPTDLFISEISDAPSGSSSLIEIFNGTAASIDLSDYSIRVFNNGSATPSTTANLTGTLAPGGVHVISVGTTSCDLTGNGLASGLPNQTFNSAGGINFDNNSSDMIELYNSATATPIDYFGVPGSNTWANSLGINGDGVNYRRQNTATNLPNLTFDLNDWDEIDWTSCGDSDYSNFGLYDFSLGVPPTVSVLTSPTFSCTSTFQLSVTGTEGVPAGLGLTYQWYYLAPNATVFVAVPDNADFDNVSTSTLDILNGLPYADYQFYCQVRENTATCYTASNAVKLNVPRTIWYDNAGTLEWSNGAPGISTVAVIDADYNTATNGSFSACQLLINASNLLTITDNFYVEVQNNLTVNGNIIVTSAGAFVQNNDSGIVDGAVTSDKTRITVEKETAILNSPQEYTYWSSPVSGETIADGLSESAVQRRFWFNGQNYRDSTQETNNNNAVIAGQDDIDDDANDWQFANGALTMLPGVGYAATHDSIGYIDPRRYKYTFEGPFNNGIYNIPIYRNDAEPNDNNWNFIGNPYPSAIDADLFLAANASIDQNAGATSGAIFFWSHNTAADGNNNGNEVLNYSQSDYAIINGTGETAGGDGVVPNRFIPSGQGFFVSMSDASTSTPFSGNIRTTNVVFNNSMRVTGSNAQFFRTSNIFLPNKLRLNLTSDNGIFNQILIGYVDGATDADDGMYYDAYKNLSANANSIVYSLIDTNTDKKFAIQGKAPSSLSLDEIIPLGFFTSITEATIYTLSIADLEGDFMTSNPIYLKDNLLNRIHTLSESDYSFTSDTGEFNDRFEIVFQPEILSVGEQEIASNDLTIIELQNGSVKFSVGQNLTINTIEIIDLLGRTLYMLKGHNSTEIFDLPNLSQSAYIAKVSLSNGQTITKRAIKRK
jgi:hypothetical protein